MVLFECNADEAVVTKLGCVRKNRSHLAGKSRVCKNLERLEAAVAMIDADPNSVQPPYLASLVLLEQQHDIRVYEDPKRAHRIITINPRLEDWIIKTTEMAGLSLNDFGLHNKGEALHREINSKLPNLEKLMDHLLEQQNARMHYLKAVLGLQ